MSLVIINRDILTITTGFICHQVNCKGVMGAGLALKIKNKWPVVYDRYKELHTRNSLKLGSIQVVPVSPGLVIVNIAAQDGYGTGKLHTNYNALRKCLINVRRAKEYFSCNNTNIYIPMGMGCGLAGGSWDQVQHIIGQVLPGATLCRKGQSTYAARGG